MAYCDTVAAFKLATKIQLPSDRIAIEFAPEPVETGVLAIAVRDPLDGLIRNAESWLEPVSTTYTYFANGSTAIGPGASPVGYGEPATSCKLKSASGQFCEITLQMVKALTLLDVGFATKTNWPQPSTVTPEGVLPVAAPGAVDENGTNAKAPDGETE